MVAGVSASIAASKEQRSSSESLDLVGMRARARLSQHNLLLSAADKLELSTSCLNTLLADHQRVVASAALSEALTELAARQQLSSSAPSSDFLPLSFSLALHVFEEGAGTFATTIEGAAISRDQSTSGIFFADSRRLDEGLLAISLALRSSFSVNADGGGKGSISLLAASYGILSLFLSTLSSVAAADCPGSNSSSTAFVCSPTVRIPIKLADVFHYLWVACAFR